MADFKRKEQAHGPRLSYMNKALIEQDGLFFKDLAGTGELLPYEDWRLPAKDRAKDLAKRLSADEIAGLMLISGHQSIPAEGFMARGATYGGEPFDREKTAPWTLTDQQKFMVEKDHIRNILEARTESSEASVRWNNELQALAESQPFGIPVSIATDPRHGASSSTAEFKSRENSVSKWPEGIGFAATFNADVVKTFAEIASKEYRALGISTALGPQIDLATEPRWMRMEDTLGGDVERSIAYTRGYCDGMQTTEGREDTPDPGWGKDSVLAMVKHWPGGGTGEGGRDAHYAFGEFAVYPGNNFDTHMRPFLEGAYHLDGPTKKAAATMPYYTVSWGHGEKVGNSYNTYLIKDLLREKYGYDGVICTDWGIVEDPAPEMDTFGSRCYGVEDLSVVERHLRIIMNGVDQFGGPVSAVHIREAYALGCEQYGEDVMRAQFEASAVRILTNLFRLGLFEDPFLSVEESLALIGCAEHMKAGLLAQEQSVVILKNKNSLFPLAKGMKLYVPDRSLGAIKGFMRNMEPPRTESPVSAEEAEGFFTLADSPEDADAAFIWAESPLTANKGYDGADTDQGGNGYFPISLQYRPYTADTARDPSIAGGDPHESFTNRGYKGKTSTACNECDLDNIIRMRELMGGKPVIVCMEMHNPTVPAEFEPLADGIVVQFGVTKEAVFHVLFGDVKASGKLPYRLPKNMETVEKHCEDLFNDYEVYTDSEGNAYDYGFGL
ncbi:MAG: glycoside hydrolase family 3 C-terminal domain-containing protein [Lachnospiraceae bacterium]|nr:glycoside hydrolase family 3 C-terminal domain-containing protein [Lachnospiraceae bacterium]